MIKYWVLGVSAHFKTISPNTPKTRSPEQPRTHGRTDPELSAENHRHWISEPCWLRQPPELLGQDVCPVPLRHRLRQHSHLAQQQAHEELILSESQFGNRVIAANPSRIKCCVVVQFWPIPTTRDMQNHNAMERSSTGTIGGGL